MSEIHQSCVLRPWRSLNGTAIGIETEDFLEYKKYFESLPQTARPADRRPNIDKLKASIDIEPGDEAFQRPAPHPCAAGGARGARRLPRLGLRSGLLLFALAGGHQVSPLQMLPRRASHFAGPSAGPRPQRTGDDADEHDVAQLAAVAADVALQGPARRPVRLHRAAVVGWIAAVLRSAAGGWLQIRDV